MSEKIKIPEADVDEAFMNKFVERFNLKRLAELAEKEEKTTKHIYLKEKGRELFDQGVKNPKPRLGKGMEYEKCYPETIKYLNDNIFMSDKGVYYMNSISDDGLIMPKEMTKEQLTNYKNKFPDDIRVYFEKYNLDTYHVVVNQNKPKIYEVNGIKYLNLFQGYKFDGVKRNDKVCKDNTDKVKFIWDHIKNIWCNKDDIYFKEIKNWICTLIAGKRKLKTAIYLKGKMGIGKGKIVDLLSWIIGSLNCLTLTTEHAFTGQFNGQLAAKTFVNLNEIINDHSDFVSLYNRLKPWITDDVMVFRDLYSKPIQLQNLCSFILTGNHDMFKLENNTGDDRRFIILQSCDTVQIDEYNTKLHNYCIEDDRVKEAFYWDCVDNYDSNYNEQITIKKLPLTDTKKQMIQKTLSIVTRYLKDRLEDGDFFCQRYKKKELYEDYCTWKKARETDKKIGPQNRNDFYTSLIDGEYKNIVLMKKAKIEGVAYNDVIVFDGKKLYSFMMKKGYISKYDDIHDNYITEIIQVDDKPITKTLEMEYWELEQQKNEIDEKQFIIEMKMAGVYNEFMRRKDLKEDPIEYGIEPKEQSVKVEKVKVKRIIPAQAQAVVLDEESKQNVNNTCKKLNKLFGEKFFVEF
jgi:hypothetical protein